MGLTGIKRKAILSGHFTVKIAMVFKACDLPGIILRDDLYPGQLPPCPTILSPLLPLETEKPRPHVVFQSGSVQCTCCIYFRVEGLSISVTVESIRRNCHEANFPRSVALDENPAAGVIPLAWNKATFCRSCSLVNGWQCTDYRGSSHLIFSK